MSVLPDASQSSERGHFGGSFQWPFLVCGTLIIFARILFIRYHEMLKESEMFSHWRGMEDLPGGKADTGRCHCWGPPCAQWRATLLSGSGGMATGMQMVSSFSKAQRPLILKPPVTFHVHNHWDLTERPKLHRILTLSLQDWWQVCNSTSQRAVPNNGYYSVFWF